MKNAESVVAFFFNLSSISLNYILFVSAKKTTPNISAKDKIAVFFLFTCWWKCNSKRVQRELLHVLVRINLYAKLCKVVNNSISKIRIMLVISEILNFQNIMQRLHTHTYMQITDTKDITL